MAHAKSAKKRVRQRPKVTKHNSHYKTMIRNRSKGILRYATKKDAKKAAGELKEAVSLIQKVAGKGMIHKNKASNLISRLAKHVASLG